MAKKIDYQINTGSSNERNVLFLRDRYQKLAGLNILSALVLSACGGGSGGSGSGSDSAGQPSAVSCGSGAVIKGPLENALVYLDYDGDGVLGADEPSVRTNSDGSFELSGTVDGVGFVAQTIQYRRYVFVGLDNVVLKAPSGSSVVTPPRQQLWRKQGSPRKRLFAARPPRSNWTLPTFNPYSAGADPETALAVEGIAASNDDSDGCFVGC